MKSTDCVAFLQWALPHLSLSWRGFRKVRSQVCKRIRRRMQSLGLEDFAAYQGHLDRHPEEWAILHEEKEERHYLCERSFGAFERCLRLPETIDENKLEARFDKGVLKITAAKKPEAIKAERKIEIKKP